MIHKTYTRTLTIWVMSALLFCLLVGCAAKKPFWGDPKTGLILVYRLEPGQTLRYHTSSTQNATQEMMGQSMNIQTNSTSDYTVTGNGRDAQKNILTTVTIDTIGIVTTDPQGERTVDLTPIIGKSFGLTLSSLGKEMVFSGTDSLQVEFGPMGGGTRNAQSFFRNPFPDLPENPVTIGSTWTTRDEQVEPQSGMEITITTQTTNILDGFETIDGTECLRIKSQATGTLDGTGEQMGMSMTLEGDLEASSTWYLTYKKGVFVKATSNSFMEGTVMVSGQTNMTIPITQESKAEVRLVP